MKSYTDLEQSKKLTEILPIKSADMYWLNWHIDLTETKYEVFVIDKSNKYIDFFNSYAVAIDNNEIIPCWSLAALLGLMPRIEHMKPFIDLNPKLDSEEIAIYYHSEDSPYIVKDNPIDTAFEMVCWLLENGKI